MGLCNYGWRDPCTVRDGDWEDRACEQRDKLASNPDRLRSSGKHAAQEGLTDVAKPTHPAQGPQLFRRYSRLPQVESTPISDCVLDSSIESSLLRNPYAPLVPSPHPQSGRVKSGQLSPDRTQAEGLVPSAQENPGKPCQKQLPLSSPAGSHLFCILHGN